ncbi:hypothetical protein EDC30_104353 [Paucimonas lemoignei]|uniref:Uncharacterized protein n=1 Tax=Paucimonas lemoignei TaxID=29443 RepID=A0A4R3I135_PAULE|nr:hypothetical protein [Paucimonas lemoignei]TCS37549.1 hypothetical protein EDC30_104353 [Paucimonas lemoignei]
MVKPPFLSRVRGQAMVELLIAGGLVLIPLFLAIPLLGKYLDIRATAVQTSRYAAWERTVWYGGDAATSLGWFGVSQKWQANEKSDDQIRRELGARQLAETSAAFSNADRSSSNFNGGAKALWQDRKGKTMLADYSAVQNKVDNGQAPGTLNVILDPIANFAATLGPFVLETNGKYAAKVSMNVRDIDYDHFLLKDTTAKFSETTVLLANGWNANGPDDPAKTSVKQQVKGLVPTTLLDVEFEGVNITDFVLGAISLILPEASKLEPGKIVPDEVPKDRVK